MVENLVTQRAKQYVASSVKFYNSAEVTFVPPPHPLNPVTFPDLLILYMQIIIIILLHHLDLLLHVRVYIVGVLCCHTCKKVSALQLRLAEAKLC